MAFLVTAVAIGSVPATGGALTAAVTNSTNSTGAAQRFTCSQSFNADVNKNNAYLEYALSGSGATESDLSSTGDFGTYQAAGSHPTGGLTGSTACPRDTGSFYSPSGTSDWITTNNSFGNPGSITLAIWFATTTTSPGYLIGFNSSATATSKASDGSMHYDRHLYIDTNGRLVFGMYNPNYSSTDSRAYATAISSSAVNDGKWHQAVATWTSTLGSSLWLDGNKVASNAGASSAVDNYTGAWRIASGVLDGWPNASSTSYFRGGLRFAAVYKSALSDTEITRQYSAGRQ